MITEYKIEESKKEHLASIASLWKRMINYYYSIERNFTLTEDSEERYLRYIVTIHDDNLTKIIISRKDDTILGFMIEKISLRPPVIVKGHIGIIEDYWVNRLYLDKNTQKKVKEEIFLYIKKWFEGKMTERIRLEISIKSEEEKLFWEGLGFKSNKWVMYK